MNDRIPITLSTDEFRHKAGPKLLALGMWVRFAVVGSLTVVGGLVQLLGEATDVAGLAFVIGGLLLVAVASWRTRALLGDAHPRSAGTAALLQTVGRKSAPGRLRRNAPSTVRRRPPALATE